MNVLLVIEALFLVALLAYTLRRVRPAPPPYRAPLGWILLATAAQAALLILADIYLESLPHDPGPFARQLPLAVWVIWVLQLLRAVAIILAAGAWFRIAMPELGRRFTAAAFVSGLLLLLTPDSLPAMTRIVVLALAVIVWFRFARPRISRRLAITVFILGLALVQLPPSFLRVLGGLTLLVVLVKMKWSGELHGFTRFAVLIGSGITLLLLSIDVRAVITPAGFGISLMVIGNVGEQSIIQGTVSGPALFPHRLTGIWNYSIQNGIIFLRLVAVVAFFKLLVVPVRLRGLSLARRFTMTFVLFRVIPGVLGLLATVLIIYFGFGWQRARLAKTIFTDTLNNNLMAAEAVLERAAPMLDQAEMNTSSPHLAPIRRWLGPDSSRAHFVIRRYDPAGDASHGDGTRAALPDSAFYIYSTPGTPPELTAHPLFQSWVNDSVGGLIVRNGCFYLAAGVAGPDRKASSEVYVLVDSLFLRRVMHQVAADITLRAKPTLFLTETAITANSDSAWTDTPVYLHVAETPDTIGTGFLGTTRYLARTLLPVGDWLEQRRHKRSGIVFLTLSTSIGRTVRNFTDEPYFLSSNSIPIVMLVVILVLFLFAELSAVRTGRSIAGGILQDVRQMAKATKRFGEGDLDHRIPVTGKDELSTLASSFNTMARDIREHQKVLLEKERLEADLAVARDIQQRMLPQEAPTVPGLDIAGVSIPSREVGGDLYSFSTLPDGTLGIAIGDVSGKSVPAALLMSNTVAAFRAETRMNAAADHVIAEMNRLIADQVEPGKFVTFFYGIVDTAAETLRYCCAGHNPPLKMNAGGDAEWIPEAGLPLGVYPDAEYTAAEVAFSKGDILVLYSDGVTEAERDHAGAPPADGDTGPVDDDEFFGEERMESVIRSARTAGAGEIIQALLDAIRDYSGDGVQSDDLTIIVVKCGG